MSDLKQLAWPELATPVGYAPDLYEVMAHTGGGGRIRVYQLAQYGRLVNLLAQSDGSYLEQFTDRRGRIEPDGLLSDQLQRNYSWVNWETGDDVQTERELLDLVQAPVAPIFMVRVPVQRTVQLVAASHDRLWLRDETGATDHHMLTDLGLAPHPETGKYTPYCFVTLA